MEKWELRQLWVETVAEFDARERWRTVLERDDFAQRHLHPSQGYWDKTFMRVVMWE